jgi:hypothetical protein
MLEHCFGLYCLLCVRVCILIDLPGSMETDLWNSEDIRFGGHPNEKETVCS